MSPHLYPHRTSRGSRARGQGACGEEGPGAFSVFPSLLFSHVSLVGTVPFSAGPCREWGQEEQGRETAKVGPSANGSELALAGEGGPSRQGRPPGQRSMAASVRLHAQEAIPGGPVVPGLSGKPALTLHSTQLH